MWVFTRWAAHPSDLVVWVCLLGQCVDDFLHVLICKVPFCCDELFQGKLLAPKVKGNFGHFNVGCG